MSETTHSTFFGKLIAAIGSFFAHLVTGAKNAFEELDPQQQQAIIQGVNVSQIIKEGYTKGADFVIGEVATKLNMPTDVAEQVILTALKDIHINVTSVQSGLDKLANAVQAGITDNNWNGIWQSVATSAAQWLATGKLDWVSLSMGLVEWAFQHFLKAKTA